jgi:hypothetical protein
VAGGISGITSWVLAKAHSGGEGVGADRGDSNKGGEVGGDGDRRGEDVEEKGKDVALPSPPRPTAVRPHNGA